MNLIPLVTKELVRYHCGCHANIVTIAIEYVADACHPTKKSFVSNVNSIALKAKELLRYHCGYHGNIVTIAIG